VLVVCAACSAAPRTGTGTGTEEITVWRPLGKWSGSGLLQTDAFIGNSGLLRIAWNARNVSASNASTLRIVLHSDVSGRPLTPVVEQEGPGGGVRYVTEDPRSFFLLIEASGLEWSVEVAEGVAATRAKPR
jgi:hypothetical protein